MTINILLMLPLIGLIVFACYKNKELRLEWIRGLVTVVVFGILVLFFIGFMRLLGL